jgi:PKHD-type hydroxylase
MSVPSDWKNNYLFNTSFYPQVFSPDECAQIIALQGLTKQSGLAGKSEALEEVRNSTSTFLPMDASTRWIHERIYPLVQFLNEQYYHFRIEVLSPAQVIEYREGGFYDWHVDLGYDDLSARKLSVVVFLTDRSSYQGGILKLVSGLHMQADVPQEQGTVIFFPAYMLHKVEPVLQGMRHSLVMWAYGPSFS